MVFRFDYGLGVVWKQLFGIPLQQLQDPTRSTGLIVFSCPGSGGWQRGSFVE